MTLLDDPASYAVDRSGMWRHIAEFGPQLTAAWRASAELELPIRRTPDHLVIAGTGGSAAAGEIVAALASPTSEIPIVVARGTSLPNFVGERTLVIVVSCSGNTAETHELYDDAWRRDAPIVAITRGGQLAERCAADDIPCWTFAYEAPPRAAIAHTLAPLLRIVERLGLTVVTGPEVEAAARLHQELVEGDFSPVVPAARNPAKQAALHLVTRIPLVLAPFHLAPIAERTRNQLAENAKILAAAAAVPDAAHNLVVGLSSAATAGWALLVLDSAAAPDPYLAAITDIAAGHALPVVRYPVPGETPLRQAIAALAFGDALSCYLAIARGVDPTPIPEIDHIKRRLTHLPHAEIST